MRLLTLTFILVSAFCAVSQTVDAYGPVTKTSSSKKTLSLLDPSRFSISHALSFGASSSTQFSGLKSQSLYSSLITYQFSKPVTLNLNFSLPIHSTYSTRMNLNANNIESMDYFKSIPFSAGIQWQPRENLLFNLSVSRAPYYYDNNGIWGTNHLLDPHGLARPSPFISDPDK